MVNYSCDKCGKKFTQKGHYTRHMNKKNPCIHMSKINEMVDAAVEKRLKETNFTTRLENTIISPTTSKLTSVREQGLDKFYTIPSYSKKCIHKVNELYDNDSWDLIVEPSAGNGSFYNQIESSNKIGIDIAPEIDGLVKQDFFTYQPPENNKRILVIGNPPFGRVSSLAIRFFNHAAQWADVIAFIIPKTFRRISVQNKLNDSFHLMYDEDVPDKPCSFTPNMSVKCCFQIWERKSEKRPIIKLDTTHPDWRFLPFGPKDDRGQPTPPKNADFAIRAYGGNIGEIVTDDLQNLRPKSWHWVTANINKNELMNVFTQLDYSNSLNTARQNSMGRGELVLLYTQFRNAIQE